jgi:hypothetical protein
MLTGTLAQAMPKLDAIPLVVIVFLWKFFVKKSIPQRSKWLEGLDLVQIYQSCPEATHNLCDFSKIIARDV